MRGIASYKYLGNSFCSSNSLQHAMVHLCSLYLANVNEVWTERGEKGGERRKKQPVDSVPALYISQILTFSLAPSILSLWKIPGDRKLPESGFSPSAESTKVAFWVISSPVS